MTLVPQMESQSCLDSSLLKSSDPEWTSTCNCALKGVACDYVCSQQELWSSLLFRASLTYDYVNLYDVLLEKCRFGYAEK